MHKKINLQLFSEGAPEGGQAPSVSEQLGSIFDSATTAQPDSQAQAGEGTPQGAEAEGQSTQQPLEGQTQQPEQQEQLILGKFKNTDEVFKSYRNLESTLTKTFMEKSNIAKEKAALEAKVQDLEAKLNNPTIPQPAQQFQQPQAQEPAVDPEKFLEDFYKDPVGSLKKVVEDTTKTVTEKVKAEMQEEYKPVISEFQQQKILGYWNSALAEFASKTPDFEQHLDAIQKFMSATGLGNETDPAKISQNLEFAYAYARGTTATAPDPIPSNPDDLLKDESFVEKILENPDIKQKIIDQHMQTIQQNRPPQGINTSSGMIPATSPPQIPKNKNEAARLAGAIFDSNFASN